MKHLCPPALALLFAIAAPGCMPEGSPPDGEIGSALPSLQVDFLWPDDESRVTEEAVIFDAPSAIALVVRLENHSGQPLEVTLQDLIMRPVPTPGEWSGGEVEAVYAAPPPLVLLPGEVRRLDFGQVTLFFGFACTVHVSGTAQPVGLPAHAHAVAHDSRPILLDF